MAAIPVQDVGQSGSEITYSPADGDGDTFNNTGNPELTLKNANVGVDRTVTMVATGRCSHGFLHNLSITVPAQGEVRVRDIDTKRFGETVSLTYDSADDLTLAVVR